MLTTKANFLLRPTIHKGYTDVRTRYIKQKERYLFTLKKYNWDANRDQLCLTLFYDNDNFKKENISRQQGKSLLHGIIFGKNFCTKTTPKIANVFGDLADEKYERVEMDEDEKKEERFSQNDAKIPRWRKRSPGQYANLIKSYIEKGDLNLALHVLQLVKECRDLPTQYMYSLLIRAFAMQGNVIQCFKLYNQMKKYGLDGNGAIYNSLINSCATTSSKEVALKHLNYLRQYFTTKNIVLNGTHYATFIKAYAWHKEIIPAFQIADEAKDKQLISSDIYATLFHAVITDKKNGLKYALTLWHQMRLNKLQMSVIHYNLLLKAIQVAELGNLKVNDLLVPNVVHTQVHLIDSGRSNLLSVPPVVSTTLLTFIRDQEYKEKSENTMETQLIDGARIISENLNNILEKNRLILFGGIEQLLKQMEDDGVEPDIKTMTMIMNTLPPSIEAEEYFLSYVKYRKIKVDIALFNVLIKRRCMRKRYKDAKAVLDKIQTNHLTPDIITFGILAMGCRQSEEGMELLKQMNHIGLVPNQIVLGTLLYTACIEKDFNYILQLLNYMLENQIQPSEYIFETVQKFEELVVQFMNRKNRWNRKEAKTVEYKYNTFKILYDEWKATVCKKDDVVKMSK